MAASISCLPVETVIKARLGEYYQAFRQAVQFFAVINKRNMLAPSKLHYEQYL